MKRKIICLLAVITEVFLCGCSAQHKNVQYAAVADKSQYITGVWITYSELDAMLKTDDFKSAFDGCADKCAENNITDLYIHIRAFGDSIYKSAYFPLRESAQKDFDVLEYIVESCHKRNLRVHAWINPYRIKTSDADTSTLPAYGTVYGWLTDADTENDKNICVSSGLYLDPASAEVRKLIIDGIREVISSYKVDGIHFDDYFYPTQDSSFDSYSYEKYTSSNKSPLGLADWRRANVNALISGCYTAVKFMNKDIVFSISPAASISRNYDEYYADAAAWIENGCVDEIIPQLYFGFEYPDKQYRFDKLLSDWKKLTQNSDVKLVIGLAAYKVATEQKPDNEEWGKKTDILYRQAEACRKDEMCSGHIFFSYSYLFSENEPNLKARQNLF